MKKLLIVLLIAFLLIAADMPPALPSSFWGTVTGAKTGQTVSVYIGRNVVARTQIFAWEGKIVYSLDVPMGSVGSGVKDGTISTFKVAGIVAGSAALHSGTITNLNLSIARGRWK
jgi:hypothetical protein